MTVSYENLNRLNAPYKQQLIEQLADMLDHGQFVLGSHLLAFEQEFAQFVGAPYCVGVANGLDALTLSLIALDLPPKSEVLVPANTYIATINAIILAGHIPVFVEPNLRTYNIDPHRIIPKITPRTRALMIVHLYGKCCDMQPILDICQHYQLRLIEDCAQAHGAAYKEQKQVGTFGDAAGFSFYPTKNLGALGDAGAVVCQDEEMYKKVNILRNYGQKIKYVNEVIGYNSRLDELQAAFLRIKLRDLNQYNAKKTSLANVYFQHLPNNHPDLILPIRQDECGNVFHIFPIRHPQRDKLQQYLQQKGITAIQHYPIAPADQTSIRHFFEKNNLSLRPDEYPISRLIHQTELSLPCSAMHSEDDIKYVAQIVNEFLG